VFDARLIDDFEPSLPHVGVGLGHGLDVVVILDLLSTLLPAKSHTQTNDRFMRITERATSCTFLAPTATTRAITRVQPISNCMTMCGCKVTIVTDRPDGRPKGTRIVLNTFKASRAIADEWPTRNCESSK